MEEQTINTAQTNAMELEEEVISAADDSCSDEGLGDVVPCEYVAIEQSEGKSFDMAGTSDDGFYDDVGYVTPSVTTNQMVDITSQVVGSSSNELEEEAIPNELNTPDDEQLDDVV